MNPKARASADVEIGAGGDAIPAAVILAAQGAVIASAVKGGVGASAESEQIDGTVATMVASGGKRIARITPK